MDAPASNWTDLEVRDVGEEVVAALGAAGVEYVFFTSGSEICFFQEAVAKSAAIGRPAPKLVTITHEHVGLNAALGYAAVSGKPAVTAVHVDAGTLHQGAAIHTAYRSRLPVLMTAGGAPCAYPGSMKGARDAGGHIWMQQTYDQNSIVRQYMKWEHRLAFADNPGLTVGRALQVATSEPRGPVYLTLPSEIAYRETGTARFPTLDQLGVSVPPAPDTDGIAEVAQRLVRAKNPHVVVSGSGRDPTSVPALVTLCELLGLPVVSSVSRAYLSFPMNHPLYQGMRSLADADMVLVIDADVPWMPGPEAPPSDAYVAVIDLDPIKLGFPSYEFTADLRLVSDPRRAILALTDAVRTLVGTEDAARFEERRKRWSSASQAAWAALTKDAESRSGSDPIDQLWLSHQIGAALREDDIVFNEALPRTRVHEFMRMARPGSYFSNPGTSGGWAPGAALGAKFAAPDRDVIAVTGDGFYMFSTPVPALWAARHYQRPFMTIVYQNRSYSTATFRVDARYPDSYAARQDFDYQGGYFDPPVDFVKEAEAAGAYGESVRDPAEIAPAIERGREQLRRGIPAVISVWLPRIGKPD